MKKIKGTGSIGLILVLALSAIVILLSIKLAHQHNELILKNNELVKVKRSNENIIESLSKENEFLQQQNSQMGEALQEHWEPIPLKCEELDDEEEK
jgi:predicted PurR-regulated permease PerM